MKHLFVPYGLALILKQKDFSEPCFGKHFVPDSPEFRFRYNTQGHPINYNDGSYGRFISAPMYQQVVDWFRDVHKIIIVIDFYNNGDEWLDTTYDIRISEFKHFKTHDTFVGGESKNYYDVFNTAIEEALKLI